MNKVKNQFFLLAMITIIIVTSLMQAEFRERLFEGKIYPIFIILCGLGSWAAFFIKRRK